MRAKACTSTVANLCECPTGILTAPGGVRNAKVVAMLASVLASTDRIAHKPVLGPPAPRPVGFIAECAAWLLPVLVGAPVHRSAGPRWAVRMTDEPGVSRRSTST